MNQIMKSDNLIIDNSNSQKFMIKLIELLRNEKDVYSQALGRIGKVVGVNNNFVYIHNPVDSINMITTFIKGDKVGIFEEDEIYYIKNLV